MAIACATGGCGRDADSDAPAPGDTPTKERSETTPGHERRVVEERIGPASEPHSTDPMVLAGTYTVKGKVTLALGNPAVRFPDKNPGATTVEPTGERAKDVAKLTAALEASTWHFKADGTVTATWTDPFVNRAIDMTGSWSLLFGKFDVQVKNPVVTNVMPDGSPNAVMSMRGEMTRVEGTNHLRMSNAPLGYYPPGSERIAGGCSFELEPAHH